MSHDLIDRAEKAMHGSYGGPTNLIGELVTELKAAREKIAEQKEWIKELMTSDE
jgi:hypothetical protein